MKSRSRIALLIATLFSLSTGTITAYQSMSKTIAIVDDGKVTQYETADVYVGDVLKNQDIMITNKDQVEPKLETHLEDGMKIVIERWHPTVTLIHNGTESTFETEEMTVGELLTDRQIIIDEDDFCSQPLEAKIRDGLNIEVNTKEVSTEVIQEAIPFETEIRKTDTLDLGVQKVVSEGKEGVKEIVKEIVHVGGALEESYIKEETIVTQPQPRIIEEGTREIIEVIEEVSNTIKDEKTGQFYEYTKALTLEATAYTDIPGDRWEGITASGMPTFVGMVAVDPKVIPLHTILYVEGYGIAIAGDTGGAIKGHDIDLFFETRDQAYEFGRRDRQVYVLEDQSLDVLEVRQDY